jgi:DNA-binding PadR family transcriptional regulator
VATRRKVGNLLALAILVLLAERPMHPYEMATLLRERGKEGHIRINWGSLYTVVANLEKHGLIEATHVDRQGRRPERTVYRIRPEGREEARDWLRELIRNPEKEYPRFGAALSEMGALPPAEVEALLERRLVALDAKIAEQRAGLAQWSKALPRLFMVESEYDLAMREAESAWVRSFHETGQIPPEFTDLEERVRRDRPAADKEGD